MPTSKANHRKTNDMECGDGNDDGDRARSDRSEHNAAILSPRRRKLHRQDRIRAFRNKHLVQFIQFGPQFKIIVI